MQSFEYDRLDSHEVLSLKSIDLQIGLKIGPVLKSCNIYFTNNEFCYLKLCNK